MLELPISSINGRELSVGALTGDVEKQDTLTPTIPVWLLTTPLENDFVRLIQAQSENIDR